MKYTLEQRLDIGRRIYEGELTRFQAAEEYGTQTSHIKKWVRTLKNQYFSAQISFPTNIYAQHNACCMYFGSR